MGAADKPALGRAPAACAAGQGGARLPLRAQLPDPARGGGADCGGRGAGGACKTCLFAFVQFGPSER